MGTETNNNKISVKINQVELEVDPGTSVLEAAKQAGIHIPTLCHMDLHDIKMVNKVASCRVCMVELVDHKTGKNKIAPSCVTNVFPGMEVVTHSMRALTARRTAVELLLSNHPNDCLTCAKNTQCDLQSLAFELGIRQNRYAGEKMNNPCDATTNAIQKDPNKCIYCRRCETMCNDVQTCGILSGIGRGFEAYVGPAFDLPLTESSCTYCGQCVQVCPTAALTEVNNVDKVWAALNNPDKHVVVQTAPAIRVALGELFGYPPGTEVTGKMVSALREMGFDGVFDTDFGADLTVMEEAAEFIDRLQNGGTLPILTSCCPAWVKFIEHQFPDMLAIPSSCKSPHIMFGAILNTYYAKKHNIDPANIVVVSVMPCVAKKAEADRSELTKDTHHDVDVVITTRELAKMINETGIRFTELADGNFDAPFGESSGASVLFGTTGGVIEAVVRTAHDWLTGTELKKVEFTDLRGMDGLKEATVKIGDTDVRIGMASGLGNARRLLESIRDGKESYTAIEIMACPGGCIAGGGQPYHHGDYEIIKKRQQAIYQADSDKSLKVAHKNPEIIALYEEFLEKPMSKTAHDLLHTHYQKRERI